MFFFTTMTTDLSKILSVSGEPGLFRYISQAKNGIVAEGLATKKRTVFGMSAKVTSLSDIAIYTDDKELPLREVFLSIKEVLGDAPAPSQKLDSNVLELFKNAVPNYDRERFYLSHMKKVVQWYNLLKEHASLDFEVPEQAEENENQE